MSDGLDVITLRVIVPVSDMDEWLDSPVVSVDVNDVELAELVTDGLREQRPGEQFYAPGITGCLGVHDVAPPSRHWLGEPADPELMVDGRAAVLNCSCGAFGCGGTAARIELTDDHVTWSDFLGSEGDPVPVRTLRFDRTDYERQIAALARFT